MKSPIISIITVCRNNLPGLKHTFESIRNQKFLDFEWIIIDGNSNDGTKEYLNALNYPKFYLSEPDTGIYDAMNKGLKFVNGDYIVYMNSGDSFYDENSLNFVQSIIKNESKTPDVLLFGFTLKLPNGSFINRLPRSILNYIWHGMPTNHQAIFFSKKVIVDNPYDLSYKICGDYYLLARIFTKKYKVINNDTSTAIFDVGGTSFNKPWLLMHEAYRIKRDILKLPYSLRVLSFSKSLVSIFGLRFLSKANNNLISILKKKFRII